MDDASIAAVSEYDDALYSDRDLLITIRPQETAGFAALALEAADGLVAESVLGGVRSLGERVLGRGGAIRLQSVASDALQELERAGLLRDVVALRPPTGGAFSASSVPMGAGRGLAAVAEAAPDVERPSDRAIGNSLMVSLTHPDMLDAVRQRFAADPATVAVVERVPLRYLVDVPAGAVQPIAPWHLDRLRAAAVGAGSAGRDSAGASVAVLDTGVDADHPLLMAAVDGRYHYAAPQPGVGSGRQDVISHGTHVAGIISAHGEAGNVDGVCRAPLSIFKIFDDDVDKVKTFQMSDGRIVAQEVRYVNPVMYQRALAAAVDANYDVINLSIGGRAIGDSGEQALFQLLRDQGQIVVAAMGNERIYGSPTSWPARYDGVVAVGALDLNDGVAPFSNSGPHIEISAPGADILATMPNYPGVELWSTRIVSGQILRDKPIRWTPYRATKSGTSMAAPQVTAAAALWVGRNERDLDRFREALQRTARKVSGMDGRDFTQDYGWGCLDLAALLS